MFLIRGKMLGYTEENRGYKDSEGKDQSFLSRQLHIIDGVRVEQVELGRDFDTSKIPAQGHDVVVRVSLRAKNSRVYCTAYEVLESRPPVDAKAS